MQIQFAAGSKPKLLAASMFDNLKVCKLLNGYKFLTKPKVDEPHSWLKKSESSDRNQQTNNKLLTNLHWLSHWMIYLHIHEHYNRISNDDYMSSLLSPCFIRQRGI